MFLGGKKWIPRGLNQPQPKKPTINQSVAELIKPLGEKTWKGNVWGSVIMNVEKGTTPTPPVETYFLLAENTDFLLTESGDFIEFDYFVPPPTTTTTTGAWNPSLLSNLFEWWNTSDGITTSGSDVVSWEGFNGNIFLPQDNSNKPTYISTDTDWNNYPSIEINPSLVVNTSVGMSAPASSGVTNKTMIVVSKLLTYPNASYGYTGFYTIGINQGGQRWSILTQPSNNTFDAFQSNTNQETLFGSISLPQYAISYMSYDYSTGLYTYSVGATGDLTGGTSTTQTAGTGTSWAVPYLAVGSYTTNSGNGQLQTSMNMSVVEVIVLDGLLTPTDFSNLETYLQKYNI